MWSSIRHAHRRSAEYAARRIRYSELCKTALSPPAFEQCPVARGCAPTGPLRPSIAAHMKRPRNRPSGFLEIQ